jgi:hypothetical protein
MARPIPSRRYSFCPIPLRQRFTDRRIFSIIAKIALRNSNRFIELQTPHFANPSESYTCKLPGGIGPNFPANVRMVLRPALAPSIRRRARMMRDSASRATGKRRARPCHSNQPTTTQCWQGAKTMLLRPTESSPQPFSGLRGGPHCILSCFLGVVASCTASRTQLLGSPLFLPPAERSAGTGAGSVSSPRNTGTGSTWSPRNKRMRAWSPCKTYLKFCSARLLRR